GPSCDSLGGKARHEVAWPAQPWWHLSASLVSVVALVCGPVPSHRPLSFGCVANQIPRSLAGCQTGRRVHLRDGLDLQRAVARLVFPDHVIEEGAEPLGGVG